MRVANEVGAEVVERRVARLEGGARMRSAEETSPLVSILSVVYKDREATRLLIENLAPFRGPDLELIFIDGGSTDGTVELLRENEDRVDYWMSEPDRGVYDAMNKGLKAARGRWMLHINGGDELLTVPYDRLHGVASGVDMLACRVEHPDHGFTFIPRMNWTFRYQTTLQHQGLFYRRARHCGYDAGYRLLGDVEATQRMVLGGSGVEIATDVVSIHHGGGLSDVNSIDAEWSRCIRNNYGALHQYAHAYLFMPSRRLYRALRKKMR